MFLENLIIHHKLYYKYKSYMISDCQNMSVKGGSEKPSRPGKILGNIGVIKSSRKVSFRYVNNKLYKQNCAPLKKTKKKNHNP